MTIMSLNVVLKSLKYIICLMIKRLYVNVLLTCFNFNNWYQFDRESYFSLNNYVIADTKT